MVNYAIITPDAFRSNENGVNLAVNTICKISSNMVWDPYDKLRVRKRCIGTGEIDIRNFEFKFHAAPTERDGIPAFPYFISKDANPEDGGCVRYIPYISEKYNDVSTFSPILKPLIKLFIGKFLKVNAKIVYYRYHLIRYIPRLHQPAVSTPTGVHHDDVEITSILLMNRISVSGGDNYIIKRKYANQSFGEVPEGGILYRKLLAIPLDGLMFDDKRVAHYVSPMSCVGGTNRSSRDILITDFFTEKEKIYK